MKAFITILALLVLSACSSFMSTEEENQHDIRYQVLLVQVKSNPSINTVIALRGTYPHTKNYPKNLIIESQLHQRILNAMADNNWQDCLTYSQQLLSDNYTSLSGHYGAMVCSIELDQKENSIHHQNMINMLLEAIWNEDNGESIESAFMALSELEISQFIEFHALDIIQQQTIVIENKMYKRLSLRDSRNKDLFNWYFDISAFAKN